MRVRNKIKPETADEQRCFVEGKGKKKAIHTLRIIIERALEEQKEIYLCFIDYTKAFDRLRHDKIITQLTQLKINGKDLPVIKNMCWEQTAAMRGDGEIRSFIKQSKPVSFSPDLFSLYSEIIMWNLDGYPGIKIGGHYVNIFRYTVLIAENKEDLQQLLDIVQGESNKYGFELNRKKTEVLVVSQNIDWQQVSIFINGNKLEQRDQFKFLGTLLSSDGRNNTEIISRISQAKKNFQRMKSILTNNQSRFTQEEEPWSVILNPFWCMDARPGQFQNSYKRNWRQQKYGSFGECYESHGQQRNQTKRCYEK